MEFILSYGFLTVNNHIYFAQFYMVGTTKHQKKNSKRRKIDEKTYTNHTIKWDLKIKSTKKRIY